MECRKVAKRGISRRRWVSLLFIPYGCARSARIAGPGQRPPICSQRTTRKTGKTVAAEQVRTPAQPRVRRTRPTATPPSRAARDLSFVSQRPKIGVSEPVLPVLRILDGFLMTTDLSRPSDTLEDPCYRVTHRVSVLRERAHTTRMARTRAQKCRLSWWIAGSSVLTHHRISHHRPPPAVLIRFDWRRGPWTGLHVETRNSLQNAHSVKSAAGSPPSCNVGGWQLSGMVPVLKLEL